MKILSCWEVIEVSNDEAPEPFGFVSLDHKPEVGEVIQLYWLDGSPAYKRKVVRVYEHKMSLDVTCPE